MRKENFQETTMNELNIPKSTRNYPVLYFSSNALTKKRKKTVLVEDYFTLFIFRHVKIRFEGQTGQFKNFY